MTRRRFAAFLLLFVFGMTAACGQSPQAAPPPLPTASAAPAPEPIPEPTPTPEPVPEADPVEEALAGLTLEQKVSQLLVAGFEGTTPGADAVRAVQEYQVGGLILFGRNIESAAQLTDLTNALKALNGDHLPLFLCVDQEGGRVDRMPPEVDRTPSAYAVGGTLDAERFGAAYGTALAAECAAFGFNMDFAPCLDIWSNPENTVIGNRAFGNEWERVAQFGAAAVSAMGAQGTVVPVVKHFPGHGDTAVDSHVGLPVVDKTLEELRQSELRPFAAVLRDGAEAAVPAVMVAHIQVTELDPERPASLSPAVVTGLLREELGFGGVVCTDDLTMGAVSNTYGMGEAAVLAVEAGCDLLLACHGADNLSQARQALLAAVETGRIPPERLDESVRRILSLKMEYAVTNDPVEYPDVEALNALVAECLPK